MKSYIGWFLKVVAIVSLFALLAACAPAAPSPTPTTAPPAAAGTAKPAAAPPTAAAPAPSATPRPLTKVRYGHSGLVADAGAFIGAEKGYFKEQGIEVELVNFSKTADIIPAMGTGQIEVSSASQTPSLYNAILRGIPLKIVADKGTCSPGWGGRGLMVRTDLIDSGQYKGIGDLKGKSVGHIAKFTFDQWTMDISLAKVGLTLKDVNEVFLDAPSTVTAMANKSIDAALQGEPTLADLEGKGLAKRVYSCDQVVPNGVTAQIIYAPHFYKDTDLANRFMVGYIKGLRDYNDAFGKKKNVEEVVRILAANSVVKDVAMYQKMVPIGLNPDGYVSLEGYSPILEWFLKNGGIETMPDVKAIVDNQYVDYAIKTLGKYK